LAQQFDPATREALVARLRFYRDLGLTEFYRRPVDPAFLAQLAAQPHEPQSLGAPGLASENWDAQAAEELHLAKGTGVGPYINPALSTGALAPEEGSSRNAPTPSLFSADSQYDQQEAPPIPRRKPFSTPPQIAEAVPPADHAAALQLIRDDIGDCTRCPLHKGRNKLVFGDGSPTARLMFVGEGPGADEDAQGLPFVGRAGQLLNNMIAAMGLKREQVYIANVVKCRPPGNRTPEPEEGNTCSPFLFRQIDVIRPQVLVALGATAATYLLGQRQPLAGLRGRVHAFRGSQLIVTYHPAYLLRDPRQKKEAWADLQIAMRELGLKPPAKS
jgi:DNA polymerase